VSTFDIIPSEGLEALWDDPQTSDTESASLRWENEAWTLEVRSSHLDSHLVARLGPSWQIRQLLVFRDLDEPDLWLATDGASRWGEVNGAHREDLDGCSALTVQGSVALLLAVVRTLPLHEGHAAEIKVAHVDTDSWAVLAHRWRVTRQRDRDFVIEDLTAATTWNFTTDAHGVPLDVAGRRRVI
jgi:hypothetical protein